MKRFNQGSDSRDSSNSQRCFEIRHNSNRPMLLSPHTREHELDEDISGREAMLRRRKLPKTTATLFPPSSSASSKMIWSKKDEIFILSGILEYQSETETCYNQDWDAFYGYIRESMRSDFSKAQIMGKVKKLKKRFKDNEAKIMMD
ncbi:GLABROUS1 enhancer-binding protein-like 3 [Capsella rubella]|uniref:GLABROUS1 enhancer-binding protein-like 3 n=1 Tax=Capsella rubella TaxID=81985 RepID=UPI000CD4E7F4|nr:GLABROUS1 enhancer-binding protein-like 3 [Capsella rubella]XP_023635446.1 GLABROUS1 enhancer-binding protein-like 3 [Capsella rubella]